MGAACQGNLPEPLLYQVQACTRCDLSTTTPCVGGGATGSTCENVRLPMIGSGEDSRDAKVHDSEEVLPATLKHDLMFESVIPIPRERLDFDAFCAIPTGWRRVATPACEGFLLAGGDACTIQSTRDKGGEKNVLLALPKWAVDMQRVRWLLRTSEGCETLMLRLHGISEIGEKVFFQMDFPTGESLESWLERNGRMFEVNGQMLCKELLQFLTDFQNTPLCLRCLMDVTTVYLTDSGLISCLIPLGCLLSMAGAKAAMLSLKDQGRGTELAPEMRDAISVGHHSILRNPDLCFASDTYAMAMLVLQAMTRRGASLRDRDVRNILPECANSFLSKALSEHPDGRLVGKDALEHSWLQVADP